MEVPLTQSTASAVAARRLERAQQRSTTSTSSAACGMHWLQKVVPAAADIDAGQWPRAFSKSEGPEEYVRARVQKALLQGAPQQTFTLRGGEVSLSGGNAALSGLLSLSECADTDCGCYRLTKPWVRASMARGIGRLSALSFAKGDSVRYLSIGCGMLLTDLQVLCALQEAGFTIESAAFVDECLGVSKLPSHRKLRDVGHGYD